MTYPISTYCYYRTKYHISQENFLHFVQIAKNKIQPLCNLPITWQNLTQKIRCDVLDKTFSVSDTLRNSLLSYIIHYFFLKVNSFFMIFSKSLFYTNLTATIIKFSQRLGFFKVFSTFSDKLFQSSSLSVSSSSSSSSVSVSVSSIVEFAV